MLLTGLLASPIVFVSDFSGIYHFLSILPFFSPQGAVRPSKTSSLGGQGGTNGQKTTNVAKVGWQQHLVDDVGRLVRGRSNTPTIRTDQYDAMVHDPWSGYPPQPVDIRQGTSIHDHYDILEEIGTGAFGVVHRCVDKATGKVYAAKFVPTRGGESEKETVRNEIKTMSALRHPGLLSLHDAFETEEELIMVYEFMSGGELFEKASSEASRMSEEESRKYIRQICEALQHMHEMSFVHLDLKPENIMFSTRNSDKLKLIDFGLATKIDPNRGVKVSTGTPEFAAPEVVEGKEVGFNTDMWSVGVLAYILLSGLSPFGGENDEETLENVRKCDWSMEGVEEFDHVSEHAKDFIRRLLVANPRERMNGHQALEHPWLAELRQKEELAKRQIPSQQFNAVRNRVRSRYDAWPEPLVPIGRLAQFSSLRIHHPGQYAIRNAQFDQNDAQPRFVLRPRDTHGREGQTASFFCKVLSPTLLRLNWWKDGEQLYNGEKYRQQCNVNDHSMTIGDLVLEDTGEYTVRAENEFGQRECQMFLNVMGGGGRAQKSPSPPPLMTRKSNVIEPSPPPPTADIPPISPANQIIPSSSSSPLHPSQSSSSPSAAASLPLLNVQGLFAEHSAHHRRQWPQLEMPRIAEQRGPPSFSFALRPRLIQKNHDCKLLCTVSANPPPKIEWLKDGQPVDMERVQTMYKSGVASLEIYNTRVQDSGVYTCLASNEFGEDQTSAPLNVETRHSPKSQMNSIRSARHSISRTSVKKSSPYSGGSSSDIGNARLMAGLVGERREKLANKVAQHGRDGGGGTTNDRRTNKSREQPMDLEGDEMEEEGEEMEC